MKKRILLLVLVIFAVCPVFAAPKGPKITLKNSTGYEIAEIYVSPADSDDWGDDYLVNMSLDDGDTFTMSLPRPLSEINTYDIQFVDIEGDSYSQFEVHVKSGDTIEITMDDLDVDEDYEEETEAAE
jgi:hypothetical protein